MQIVGKSCRQTRPARTGTAMLLGAACLFGSVAVHAEPATATSANTAPIQSVGFRDFMLDAERSGIKTDGLRCLRVASTPWKEVCGVRYARGTSTDRPALLGAWVDDITLTFLGNRLAGIEVSFDSRAFSRVVRGLSLTYGMPSKQEQEIYSGGPGIRIASPKTLWELPGGSIVAREMAGQASSSARFYTAQMLALIDRERLAGLRPKNSGL